MKGYTLFIAMTLASVITGELAPPERSYKILMLLPVSSKSHRNVFMPLAEALAERGHKIVMLVNHQPASKHPNIQEINHDLPDYREENFNMFEIRADEINAFSIILPTMARKLYKIPKVKKLYDTRKEFDLVVINSLFNELAYPFAHEMPFITIATAGMDFAQSAVLGNVLNPAYVPTFMQKSRLSTNILDRFLNTMDHIMMALNWRILQVIPPIQKEISALFPDLPPLLEIERNQSLVLMNSHFSMVTAVPLLPTQVEVGTMHCRPGKPLPKDLESFINGAGPEGVIYFSLGSFTQGNSMPIEYRDIFVQAFKKLKQRVVWKYENDIVGISENVLIKKWLPQQDILAHPNVKVFISHGGLLSTQEALYHAKPVIVLPIYYDQPKNGLYLENSGLGIMIKWEELSVDLIISSLREIINNPKYKANAMAMQSPLHDQLNSPTDRAVFWTEYVIRHKGASHLNSPATQLSWVEFLMLDVLLMLHLAMFILFTVLYRICGAPCQKLCECKGNESNLMRKKKD